MYSPILVTLHTIAGELDLYFFVCVARRFRSMILVRTEAMVVEDELLSLLLFTV